MGRLCGGVHEISGIKAPLFLCGMVVGGFLGWVGGGGGEGWWYVEWDGGGGFGWCADEGGVGGAVGGVVGGLGVVGLVGWCSGWW